MNVDRVLDAYIECALWSCSIEDGGIEILRAQGADIPERAAGDWGLDRFDVELSDQAREAMRTDVESFLSTPDEWPTETADNHSSALDFWYCTLGPEQIGHDLWLTRNGHGAGFWDRFATGEGAAIGHYLTECAKPLGEAHLYIGDDGLIYHA